MKVAILLLCLVVVATAQFHRGTITEAGQSLHLLLSLVSVVVVVVMVLWR